MDTILIKKCNLLLNAFKTGKLGQTKMPEDSNPGFTDSEKELRLAYFTLPMALNYQRDSYTLWESALKTYNDPETKDVFNIEKVSKMNKEELQSKLIKYKLALQPNKHILTWQTISRTVFTNFGSFTNLIKKSENDYLKLKQIIQSDYKKGFPYISGPKIFNYWSFILKDYGKINLSNTEFIEIAPDTHVTQCSVILGVISKEESESLSKEQISEKWRLALNGSGINPIDMHPPLWFWSRNGFIYQFPVQ
ncbi:MAG: hypothetical protein AABX11_04380 [Nanoarchaeota archaeon]